MADTQDEQHVNGTAPAAPPAGGCAECASGGEKTLAVLAAILGVFVIIMAADMFTGGKISGLVTEAARD
jgi:hypothetical protein